jgi:ribosomal protein S27E
MMEMVGDENTNVKCSIFSLVLGPPMGGKWLTQTSKENLVQ